MKFSADQYVRPVLSAIHTAGGATGGQASINRFGGLNLRGFDEIEAVLLPSAQFDDADSVTVAVEDSPDNTNWTVRGTFPVIANDDNGLVAAFSLTTASNDADGEEVTLVAGAAAIMAARPQQLDIALTDTTPSVTALEIVVTGLDQYGKAQVGSYNFTAAGAVITDESWSAVTSIVSRGGTGVAGGGDEVLNVGITNSIKPHVGRLDGVHVAQYLRFNVTASAGAGQQVACVFNFLNAKVLKASQPYGTAFSWQE